MAELEPVYLTKTRTEGGRDGFLFSMWSTNSCGSRGMSGVQPSKRSWSNDRAGDRKWID